MIEVVGFKNKSTNLRKMKKKEQLASVSRYNSELQAL